MPHKKGTIARRSKWIRLCLTHFEAPAFAEKEHRARGRNTSPARFLWLHDALIIILALSPACTRCAHMTISEAHYVRPNISEIMKNETKCDNNITKHKMLFSHDVWLFGWRTAAAVLCMTNPPSDKVTNIFVIYPSKTTEKWRSLERQSIYSHWFRLV